MVNFESRLELTFFLLPSFLFLSLKPSLDQDGSTFYAPLDLARSIGVPQTCSSSHSSHLGRSPESLRSFFIDDGEGRGSSALDERVRSICSFRDAGSSRQVQGYLGGGRRRCESERSWKDEGMVSSWRGGDGKGREGRRGDELDLPFPPFPASPRTL